MSWKKTAAVFMTALCISGGASAYNLQSIAKHICRLRLPIRISLNSRN